MAGTLQQLLRERAEQDTVAVKYGDRSWTWREHIAEAKAQAAALIPASSLWPAQIRNSPPLARV
jgi:fatty-acyl-CoA synthase